MTKFKGSLPQKPEVILYGVIAFVLVIVSNLEFLARKLSLVDVETNQTTVSILFDRLREAISIVDGFSAAATSAVFVFWGFVGIVAFSIFTTVYQAYAELKQDVDIAKKFYHPEGYSDERFWLSVAKESGGKIGVFSTMAASAIITLSVLLPKTTDSIRSLFEGATASGAAWALLWFAALCLGITIFATTIKIVFHKS